MCWLMFPGSRQGRIRGQFPTPAYARLRGLEAVLQTQLHPVVECPTFVYVCRGEVRVD